MYTYGDFTKTILLLSPKHILTTRNRWVVTCMSHDTDFWESLGDNKLKCKKLKIVIHFKSYVMYYT